LIEDSVVQKSGNPSDVEGLRLMKTFFRITDPDRRREVVAFAEELVRQCERRPPSAAALPQDNEPKE